MYAAFENKRSAKNLYNLPTDAGGINVSARLNDNRILEEPYYLSLSDSNYYYTILQAQMQ